ncbi:MAG: hypothetical protein WC449_05710 [Candidatus Paceibacterota bacterium]
MSKHEESVAKKIIERAEVGIKKYGVTVESTDLSELDWLIHAQQEAMNLAVYLERLIDDKTTETYGFKPGDKVRIVKKVTEQEGWRNSWVISMSKIFFENINRIFEIKKICKEDGVYLVGLPAYGFPSESLELVNETTPKT